MTATSEINSHLEKARNYEESAQWEQVIRELDRAKLLCDAPGPPEIHRYKQKVLGLRGGAERRFGRFSDAERYLQEALQVNANDESQRLEIIGELAVVYRHQNDHVKAKVTCFEQYKSAKELATVTQGGLKQSTNDENTRQYRRLALIAEEQTCRAIGNLGMANYYLSLQNQGDFLHEAIDQLNERVERARNLQIRLMKDEPTSPSIKKGKMWESIGLDRLVLCYVFSGDTSKAVEYGEMSQAITKTSPDPTIRALSRFFYGYALLHHGRRDEAVKTFNYTSAQDRCTSAIALCKEPSDEYYEYLTAIVQEGIDLDGYDEQGYSALDYAVFNGNKKMEGIILEGLKRDLDDDAIKQRRQDAVLRKHYREVFQERLRPRLSHGEEKRIHAMRQSYAELLAEDEVKRKLFDGLKIVRYQDFVDHGRLPSFRDGVTQRFVPRTDRVDSSETVVFFSYRWRNQITADGQTTPDDTEHTQYGRMLNALGKFLEINPTLDKESLLIWLDYACIDQDNKDPGVTALPIVVAQCDVMISLVDDDYLERAWCAVEAVIIHRLRSSYGQHVWYEHRLFNAAEDLTVGELRLFDAKVNDDAAQLKLTFEIDRPKVAFLLRQSKLLGNEG